MDFTDVIKFSEMQYLGAVSKMTEWSQFVCIQHHSNPSLCPNHCCQRSWSWPVLWRPTRPCRTNTKKTDVLFIIGDLNAKVGSQEILGLIGKFGLGVQKKVGQRLTEFCQENTLVIANTLFQQHKRWLYTWTSPDGQHRNQIDYILCSQILRSSIQLAKTRPGADCGSDREILIVKFRLKLKKTQGKRLGHSDMTYIKSPMKSSEP